MESVMAEKKNAAPAVEPAAEDALRFTLKRKVTDHSHPDGPRDIDVLVFREPTGGDIDRIGVPVNVNFGETPPKMTFDPPVMTMMMATLAGVSPSVIRKLHTRDWTTIAYGLGSFFIPEMERLG
jgi:hypothetical protein